MTQLAIATPGPARVALTRQTTVSRLLDWIHGATVGWTRSGRKVPWFRGQVDAGWPPLPGIFRGQHDEFSMTTAFRLQAPGFSPHTPDTDRLDQWLFLMQHYGLPTRLLDWTENPLAAAFFAASRWMESDRSEHEYKSPDMGIWMLHPIELNKLSHKQLDDFPNTWSGGGLEMFKQPFGTAQGPMRFPLAVQASAVDRRVVVQRSCFTIQGTDPRDLDAQLEGTHVTEQGFYRRYTIPRSEAPELLAELSELGISFATVYPDITGLAKELTVRFGPAKSFRPVPALVAPSGTCLR
jgi:hypothetical protein